MINPFIKSLFDGYAEAKKGKRKELQWEELEHTPFLFSSDYLNEMYEEAESKEDYETILDHLYRNDATEISNYADIEERIINKYWG